MRVSVVTEPTTGARLTGGPGLTPDGTPLVPTTSTPNPGLTLAGSALHADDQVLSAAGHQSAPGWSRGEPDRKRRRHLAWCEVRVCSGTLNWSRSMVAPASAVIPHAGLLVVAAACGNASAETNSTPEFAAWRR